MLAPVLAAVLLLGPPPPRIVATGSPDSREGILQQVTRNGDGGYTYRNRRAGFTATIHPDGRVTFKDRIVSSPNVKLPFGIDLHGGTPNIPDATMPSNTLVRPQDLGSLGDDPLVKNGSYGPPPMLVTVGGRMGGVSDLAQATRYAAAKQRFLDATEQLRAKLSREHRRETERVALANLERDLEAIWALADTPASVRRETIFERWDDCEEPPRSADASAEDQARGRAGMAARLRIESWIRTRLPPRGANGFTERELDDMNARKKSRVRFDPYAPPAPPAAAATPSTDTGASPSPDTPSDAP